VENPRHHLLPQVPAQLQATVREHGRVDHGHTGLIGHLARRGRNRIPHAQPIRVTGTLQPLHEPGLGLHAELHAAEIGEPRPGLRGRRKAERQRGPGHGRGQQNLTQRRAERPPRDHAAAGSIPQRVALAPDRAGIVLAREVGALRFQIARRARCEQRTDVTL
jgi:hypothetical protein